ncbi:hypothetical protein PROP_03140 [Propionicimonas sp. T2.31MG-18]|uniref:hypothetical protein n=1 Tax=Propionicimonas sp. T2.31MG-18 TaxID=3157620 RepID=UPI0035E93F9B
MARTPSINLAELVRVPLADVPGIPHFILNSALNDWLRAKRVVVKPDHAGRPSVDLPTAYRIQEEMEAETAAEEARRQAQAEKLADAVAEAQRRRQEVYTAAYLACGLNHSAGFAQVIDARKAAWKAVAKAEAGMPAEVARQLGAVSIDGLPGAQNFPMMNLTLVDPE